MSDQMRLRRLLTLTLAALVGYLGLAASPAGAHEPSATLVTVSREGATIILEVRAPLDRYDFAYGTELATDPAAAVAAERSDLVEHLEKSITITSSGTRWVTSVTDVATAQVDGVPNLATRLVATPDAEAAAGPADLNWQFITDKLFSHKVYVVSAQDATSVLTAEAVDPATILGLITTQDPVLTVQNNAPALTSTFKSMFLVGFAHFREGPDHLLFLCLVALGTARRGRSWLRTVSRLAVLTLTFTVGHSISVATSTLGLISIPGPIIETGIALTILVAAVHAVRPTISARAELVVTAVFGLVHGFGFAGTLANLSIDGKDLLAPLLGFNTGLEAAQFLGLLVVVVPILVLARSTIATAILAGTVGIIAAGWVAERSLGFADPFGTLTRLLAGSPERLALSLAAGALTIAIAQRVSDDRGRRGTAARAWVRSLAER